MKFLKLFLINVIIFTTVWAQDNTVVNINEKDANILVLHKTQGVQNISSNAISITYDNSLLIPKPHNTSPLIWEINKTVTNSYFSKSLFADETEIDLDVYYWDQTSNNKTAFALDPTWERIIFANNVNNQVKSYGDHSGDYKFSIPQGITTDENGYVYVADAGNSKIVKLQYNTSANTLTYITSFSITGMKTPTDVRYCKFSSHESKPPILWVFDREARTLFALTLTGQVYYQITSYKYNNQYYNFEGIDRVVTPDIYAHYVYLFDNNNKSVIKAMVPARETNPNYLSAEYVQKLPRNTYITDVGTDCFGDLYLSDLFNNCLHKFSKWTGEYLGSYQGSSIINKPKRVSASSMKQVGRLSLDFYISNSWSNSYGIRKFLPGCELYNLSYEKYSNEYKIQYLLNSTADLFIEVYRNNSLIKNEDISGKSSGSHEYILTESELGSGEIKIKMKYRPYFDENYGSYQQGWKYKEIIFSTVNLSATISGPSYLSSGQSGTWTVTASGGTPPYSYSWSYYVYCDILSEMASGDGFGEIVPNAAPCGYWFSLGSTTNTASRTSDGRDFQVKCVVTDASNSTYTVTKTVGGSSSAAMMKQNATDSSDAALLEKENYAESLDNYPNPFNPTTKVSFSIPNSSHVSLRIYDILGRKVAVLADKLFSAGRYEFEFDAGNLPSGTYIYNLTTENKTITKKMLLIK